MDTKGQILGIDIGGVIIDVWQHGNDKLFFSDSFLETPEVAGALKAIRSLRDRFSAIKYVSHCTDENRARFIGWLEVHNFYEETGSQPKDMTFCPNRSDKANICKDLEISHFIDDRLEVLSSLTTVKERYLFQPRQEDLEEFKEYLSMVRVANSWSDILRLLNKE